MSAPAIDPAVLAQAIRLQALELTSRGGGSHIGSIFSCADIVATLYGQVMNVRPQEPKWPERDRFILSKGHAGAAVYVALSERGFFDGQGDGKGLGDYYTDGSIFSGHVSHKGVPGVELSTGSLGHGLGVATGMAFALRRTQPRARVFVVMSDGECDEGSVWEAAMFAGHHKLSNLVAVIDHNKLQSLDTNENTLGLAPFADKWRAFRWRVTESPGHDHAALAEALDIDPADGHGPRVVIAHTTKGKGVSFMEDTVLWHYRTARGEEYDAARAELEAAR